MKERLLVNGTCEICILGVKEGGKECNDCETDPLNPLCNHSSDCLINPDHPDCEIDCE